MYGHVALLSDVTPAHTVVSLRDNSECRARDAHVTHDRGKSASVARRDLGWIKRVRGILFRGPVGSGGGH